MRHWPLLVLALFVLPACGSGRIDVPQTSAGTGGTGNGDSTAGGSGSGASSTGDSTPSGASDGNVLGPGANANLKGFSSFIESASTATAVPADLIASVIWRESRADPTVSGGGLMQVDPQAFSQLQQEHPNLTGTLSDPQTAILAGAYYLVDMQADVQTKYGQNGWGITLRAYNSGINGVDPSNLNSTPAGTGDPNYVTAVFGYWVIVSTGQGSLPP